MVAAAPSSRDSQANGTDGIPCFSVPDARCLIDRYASYLPVSERTPRLTLGEGGTPLVRARSLERETGVPEVWLKVEGANPTGSFKDRGMVVAVAKALEDGARAVLCASTGNTAASAAAYAARAQIPCTVVLPAGQVALGKLVQPIAHGARVAEPETVATAIRSGNPASWKGAVAARDESGGAIEGVSDDEILAAYRFAARCEGVFVEPASAAAIAGLWKRAKAGRLEGVRQVVCVLTGNGLKDPDRARSLAGEIKEVDASADAVRKGIGGGGGGGPPPP